MLCCNDCKQNIDSINYRIEWHDRAVAQKNKERLGIPEVIHHHGEEITH